MKKDEKVLDLLMASYLPSWWGMMKGSEKV